MHDHDAGAPDHSDGHEMFRYLPFPFPDGQFPDNLGAAVQHTVLVGRGGAARQPAARPVRLPDRSRRAVGDRAARLGSGLMSQGDSVKRVQVVASVVSRKWSGSPVDPSRPKSQA
ncbi:hypothetical protein GCM10027614_15400 [Micromonospora vulcania]